MSNLEQKPGAKAWSTSPFPRWPWCTIAQHAIGIDSEIVLIALRHRTAVFVPSPLPEHARIATQLSPPNSNGTQTPLTVFLCATCRTH